MPMPREEDEDLFHDEDDVDFEDDAEESADADADESEKPTKKKKTAKKKTATKKTAKKKAAKKKAAKKKAKTAKKSKDDEGFGAGIDLADANGEPGEEPFAEDDEAEVDAADGAAEDDDADEFGRPKPQADHAVHLYELGRLKRTFDRDFTAEEAHAFADTYTRVSKHYGRKAVAGKKGAQPAKVVD